MRFIFGSCNYPIHRPSYIFQDIYDQNPDFFMWLGDVIYVDFPQMGIDSNMTSVVSKYNRTKHDVFYTKLRENVKIIGIYDDHDYGYNDADGSFVYKK